MKTSKLRGELSYFFEINKVFILGAGFSYPAGMPLTNELLKLLHKQASLTTYGNEPWGQAERLIRELKYYYPLHEFTHEAIQNGDFDDINIEEFLSYTSAESSFLYPGDKLTEHGSYLMSFCKKWIGEIFNKKQSTILPCLPQFYHEFAKNLSHSMVLTFNWDTIVEYLLDYNNVDYRFQLNSVNYESRNKSIPLIKLHGSIDWISRNVINLNESELESEALGEEFEDIVRAKGKLEIFYENINYPWIVLPNYDKITQLSRYGKIWESPSRYLNDKLDVIIIGFSLRPDDFHARSFIYPKLVQESREGNMRVKVIDFAKSEKQKSEIRKRFEGVHNCQFWFDGFNERAIEFINE